MSGSATIRHLKMGAVFTFIGINLVFITRNILGALIFFGILHPGNSLQGYCYYTPSFPDILGDVIMIVVFAAAYTSLKYIDINNLKIGEQGTSHTENSRYMRVIRYLKKYDHRLKDLFLITAISLGMDLFSKYFLSTELLITLLGIIFHEGNGITGVSFVLNVLKDIISIVSPLLFIYVYCKYLSVERVFAIILYTFFIIRNLCATNVLGLFTGYDLHVVAPFLDMLVPAIIVYSVICITRNRRVQFVRILRIQKDILSKWHGLKVIFFVLVLSLAGCLSPLAVQKYEWMFRKTGVELLSNVTRFQQYHYTHKSPCRYGTHF